MIKKFQDSPAFGHDAKLAQKVPQTSAKRRVQLTKQMTSPREELSVELNEETGELLLSVKLAKPILMEQFAEKRSVNQIKMEKLLQIRLAL